MEDIPESVHNVALYYPVAQTEVVSVNINEF